MNIRNYIGCVVVCWRGVTKQITSAWRLELLGLEINWSSIRTPSLLRSFRTGRTLLRNVSRVVHVCIVPGTWQVDCFQNGLLSE